MRPIGRREFVALIGAAAWPLAAPAQAGPSIALLGGVGGGLAPARLVQDLGLVLVSIS